MAKPSSNPRPAQLSRYTTAAPRAIQAHILALLGLTRPWGLRFVRCEFHALTGLWCPGCGATRAARELVHGHIWAAWTYNPLLVTLLPGLLWWYAAWLRALWRGDRCAGPGAARPWLAWVLFWLVLVFWLLRNLPWAPFCYLAPGALVH